jgi:hypothetical protein
MVPNKWDPLNLGLVKSRVPGHDVTLYARDGTHRMGSEGGVSGRSVLKLRHPRPAPLDPPPPRG